MVNDSSLGGTTGVVFDLDTQKGIAHLLASVRASEISPDQKNELRDLIFLYSNGGKDQSVRISLEQKISTYKISPVAQVGGVANAPVFSQPAPAFGASRIAPNTFSVTTPKAVVDVAPNNVNVEVQSVPPAPAPVTPVAYPAPAPQPVAAPVAQEVNLPVATAPEVNVPVEQPVVSPAPAPDTVPTQPPVEQSDYDPNRNLQRIREIKSIVNDKVGNPVNLVDINNEVGREYMGALLDAMKKLNSGTSALSAMKRLETAFIEVQKTLDEYEKNPVKLSPTPTPASTPTPSVQAPTPVAPPVMNEVQSAVPVSPAPISPPPPVAPQVPAVPQPVAQEPRPVATVAPENLPFAPPRVVTPPPPPAPVPKPVEPVSSEVVSGFESVQTPAPEAKPEPVKQTPDQPPVTEVESAWGPATDTLRAEPPKNPKIEAPIPTPANARVASLAQAEVKPRNLTDLPTASSLETSSVAGDPLFTKEVDEGLQQLLIEWSLFKKSGLFGTGPKGREHPLFVKIAALQIPLLLSGRFEGATQEIKQSITDYMNGWRYEQGIIYEHGETFEHYLRRVIRHILDLQKGR